MSDIEERYPTLVRIAGIDPETDISEAAEAELRGLAEHEGDRHDAVVELLGAIRAMAGARIAAQSGEPVRDDRPPPGHGTRVWGAS